MIINTEEYLPISLASEQCDVPIMTIYTYLSKGVIASIKPFRTGTLVKVSDVLKVKKLVEENTTTEARLKRLQSKLPIVNEVQ